MGKEDRGFASMDRARQREIASKGGKAAHLQGKAHEFSQEEAREAGRKGGRETHARRRRRLAEGQDGRRPADGTATADQAHRRLTSRRSEAGR